MLSKVLGGLLLSNSQLMHLLKDSSVFPKQEESPPKALLWVWNHIHSSLKKLIISLSVIGLKHCIGSKWKKCNRSFSQFQLIVVGEVSAKGFVCAFHLLLITTKGIESFWETLGKKKHIFIWRIVTKAIFNLLEERKWIEGIFYTLVFCPLRERNILVIFADRKSVEHVLIASFPYKFYFHETWYQLLSIFWYND